jgi:putative ABC transport system permease protein
MYLSAIAMLVGDRGKFLALVSALAFATLLISQQAGTFLGVMASTYGFISDCEQVPIWVVDPQAKAVIAPVMPDREVQRVRAVPGVSWAVPYAKDFRVATLADGRVCNCNVIGVDAATGIGGPLRMVAGRVEDLRRPDAVIVEEHASAAAWWGGAMPACGRWRSATASCSPAPRSRWSASPTRPST